MSTRSRPRKNPGSLYSALAVLGGAAFALVAILHAPGIAYVIVAILLGAGYSLIAISRRR